MDEDELRVLGEPYDAPEQVWQGVVSEALTRPPDPSLAELLDWGDNPGPDDGLATGWDDPAYGTESWDGASAGAGDAGTDLTHADPTHTDPTHVDLDDEWSGQTSLDATEDDFGAGLDLGPDPLDPAPGDNDPGTWFDPDDGSAVG